LVIHTLVNPNAFGCNPQMAFLNHFIIGFYPLHLGFLLWRLLHRPRQVADDEAASGAPERFAFRQRANVAQAFGHDAQAWAKYQCPSHARIFKGTRMILQLR
jgi:hypothetical protein